MIGLPRQDDVVARGKKTVVRRKGIADAQNEYRWRSDDELAEFDASRPVLAPFVNYHRNWSFDFRFTDMTGRSFAIEDETGRHIGNVMYYNFDETRREAEIGISIGEREFWDQGYGSDALGAVTNALLESGHVTRLYLHTLDWNLRARRAFQRVGFVESGVSWRDGRTFVLMERSRIPVHARLPVGSATA